MRTRTGRADFARTRAERDGPARCPEFADLGRVTIPRKIDSNIPPQMPVIVTGTTVPSKPLGNTPAPDFEPLPTGSSDRKMAPSYRLGAAKVHGEGQIGARVDRAALKPVLTPEEENRDKLVSSAGFQKLSAAEKQQMLDALAKHPTHPGFAGDLRYVANSENYRKLSPAMKQEVLDALSHQAEVPGSKNTCGDVVTKPGFAALGENEQRALVRVTSGRATGYSDAARTDLETMFAKPEFFGGDAAKQASMMRDFLKKQNFLPHATTAPEGTFDAPGKRVAFSVSGPKDPAARVKEYTIRIDGRDIPVIAHPTPAGKKHPSPQDIAKAIAAAPKENRDQIKSVLLEPAVRPGAFMAAGGDGIVRAYPVDNLASDDFNASAIIHETGHIVSSKLWGDDKMGPKWKPWRDAMAADTLSPSKYGHGAPGDRETAAKGWTVFDDFAESMLLYQRVKGTPQEKEMRRMFPERFKILDEVTKAK